MDYRFVWNVIDRCGLHFLAESLDDVKSSMTFAPGEAPGFHRFLHKFTILDHIRWNQELIRESIEEVCRDLNNEGVDYTWMRFSINKYLSHLRWHRRDLIRYIYDCFSEYAPHKVGLVLSLKYESEQANQRQLAKLINDPEIAEMLIGLDLVGDETFYDPAFYRDILHDWTIAGKRLFAHVGESQPGTNVLAAITDIGVTDICHGIRALEVPGVASAARDNGVCFHMAITSNRLTGVVVGTGHPIVDFIEAGLDVTIGTDDPVQCQTAMHREYRILSELVGGNTTIVQRVAQTAANRVKGNLI